MLGPIGGRFGRTGAKSSPDGTGLYEVTTG